MEKYCKNCGAQLSKTTKFCPDCGAKIDDVKSVFCPNCGCEHERGEKFCKQCGCELNPQKKTSSKKIPIIIVAVIAFILIITAVSFMVQPSQKTVDVDEFKFEIPGDFIYDSSQSGSENDEGIITKTGFWSNDTDVIEINVMYAETYVDASKVADDIGGVKRTYLGHEGYYNDLSGIYGFSYVDNNKLITVYTSNPDILNEMETVP